MIRETLGEGEPVLDVDSVEYTVLHSYTHLLIYSYVLIIRYPSETTDAVDAVAQEIADTAELNPRE